MGGVGGENDEEPAAGVRLWINFVRSWYVMGMKAGAVKMPCAIGSRIATILSARCTITCAGVETVSLARFAEALTPWLLTSGAPLLHPSWATQYDHANAYLVALVHMLYAKSRSGLPHVGPSHT